MTNVTKTVSFRSPFIGRTFQNLTSLIQGRDGYLSGGQVTEAGGFITVAPYSFVQFGIIAEEADSTAGIVVPTFPEPWFVLAALPDDDPTSGISLAVTHDITQVLGGDVLIAYKTNGAWKNPRSLSVEATARQTATEPGAESGLHPYMETTGSSPAQITDVKLSRGMAVDPAGGRRPLDNPAAEPVAAFEAGGLGLVRDGVGIGFARTDYAVLRQNEDGTGSIVHVHGNSQGQGGASGDEVLDEYSQAGGVVLNAAGSQPGAYGQRGTRSYWFAWGMTSPGELWIEGYNQSTGAITGTKVLDASGTSIHSVAIAGENSDGDLIVVYSDTSGTQDTLQIVRVSQAGAIVGSTSGIATSEDPGGFLHTRAVMGPGDIVHIVTQEDLNRATPDQVIRYYRASVADTTFGTSVVEGPDMDLGTNDTFPSIGIDRRQHIHLAYTRGSGGLDYGELRYVEIDDQAELVQAIAGSSFLSNDDPFDPKGFEDTNFDDVKRASLVVTPHDEVYVFAIAKPLLGNFTEVVVFSPAFNDRFAGHQLIHLPALFGSLTGSYVKASLAAICDDHGAFIVAASDTVGGLVFARLDTVIAPDGVVGHGYLEANTPGYSSSIDRSLQSLQEITMVPSGLGGILFGYQNGGAMARVTGQRSRGRMPTPHPNDVYLAAFEASTQPSVDGTDATPLESTFRGATLRPKQGGHTIVVGDGGDYAGSQGLVHAIEEAAITGAEIYVKGGRYVAGTPLIIPGGMKVRGSGELYFSGQASSDWLTIGFPIAGEILCTSAAADDQVITLETALAGYTQYIKPGDSVVVDNEAGVYHEVVQILDSRRFVIASSLADAAGVAGCTVYASNVDISGIVCTFLAQPTGNIIAQQLKNSRLSGLIRDGMVDLTLVGLTSNRCEDTVFESFQFLDTNAANVGGLVFLNGTRNTVRHCKLGNDGGQLRVYPSENALMVHDCTGVDGGNKSYDIDGRTAANMVRMVNCAGVIGGAGVDQVATSVADALIDQSYMADPVPFADENHNELPANSISILEQLDNEAKLRELGGANGVYTGFNPVVSGLEVTVQAGEGIGGGKVLAVASSAANTDATGVGTEWSYYVTADNQLSAVNAAPDINGDVLLVGYGVVNSGNDGFETFVDLRRFIGKDAHRSPLVVTDSETTYGGFKTLQGAILWLQTVGTGDGAVPEIIVSEMISIPSTVTTPVEVNLNSIGSLIIRGVGHSSGFKIDADTSTLIFQGSGVGSNGFRHVQVENIAFANEFSGTPTSSYCLEVDGSIDSFTARNCAIVSSGALPNYGTYGFFTVADDASLPIITIENCDLQVYARAAYVPNNVTYPTMRTRVLNNRIFCRASTPGGGGSAVAVSTDTFWVTNNVIEGPFTRGVYAGVAGTKAMVSGNRILLTDIGAGNSQIGIQISVAAIHIANNEIVCATEGSGGIALTTCTEGAINGNHIESDQDAVLLNSCSDIVLSGNRTIIHRDGATADYSFAALRCVSSHSNTITGNHISWDGESDSDGPTNYYRYAAVYLDAGSSGSVITGNIVEAATSAPTTYQDRPGGIHTAADRTVIVGNHVTARQQGTLKTVPINILSTAEYCIVTENLIRSRGSTFNLLDESGGTTTEVGVGFRSLKYAIDNSADFAAFKATLIDSIPNNYGSNRHYLIP